VAIICPRCQRTHSAWSAGLSQKWECPACGATLVVQYKWTNYLLVFGIVALAAGAFALSDVLRSKIHINFQSPWISLATVLLLVSVCLLLAPHTWEIHVESPEKWGIGFCPNCGKPLWPKDILRLAGPECPRCRTSIPAPVLAQVYLCLHNVPRILLFFLALLGVQRIWPGQTHLMALLALLILIDYGYYRGYRLTVRPAEPSPSPRSQKTGSNT
jgi:hypothetical protein